MAELCESCFGNRLMLRVKKRILFGMMACTGICHAGVEYNTDNVNVKLSGLIDTGIATVTNVKGGTKTKTEAVDSILGALLQI